MNKDIKVSDFLERIDTELRERVLWDIDMALSRLGYEGDVKQRHKDFVMSGSLRELEDITDIRSYLAIDRVEYER